MADQSPAEENILHLRPGPNVVDHQITPGARRSAEKRSRSGCSDGACQKHIAGVATSWQCSILPLSSSLSPRPLVQVQDYIGKGNHMTSTELMRCEILRLARVTRRSAFISTRRLSAFYNVPEKSVRRELAKLADENQIRLASGQSREEFVEQSPEGMAVRVDLVE